MSILLPLVHGRWASWGGYTRCTKTCNGGTKIRRRVCIGPRFGGRPCVGSSTMSARCNTQRCPSKFDELKLKNATAKLVKF